MLHNSLKIRQDKENATSPFSSFNKWETHFYFQYVKFLIKTNFCFFLYDTFYFWYFFILNNILQLSFFSLKNKKTTLVMYEI